MNSLKRIKFFTFHGCLINGEHRDNSPAADTKIDYIISVLNRLGYGVDLISRASSAEPYFLHSSVENVRDNTIRYFSSFGRTTSPLRILNRWWLEFQFFFWCLTNIKRKEQIIVYHSLGYDSAFLKLQKLKSIRIIGEVEEIYQDVSKQTSSRCRNEYKFIDVCEKYIFPTQLLDQKVNKQNRPSLVIYGVYATESITEKKFSDGKIHVVYGGTLDPNKGGAAAAAAATEFLPANYHVHICGFGDSTQIKAIVNDIQAKSKASVTFDGELKGDDYKHFIQKCDIGLSTQDPNAAFNSTSFPSKIFVYLANGLKVVSIRIPAIEQSAVVENLTFYDMQIPEKIAEAIVRASQERIIEKDILNVLDTKFGEELNKLIEG